jgi:CheY-like chemotaxis protein
MGGDLAVVSQPKQGSTFTVRLLLPNLGGDQSYIQEEDIVGYEGATKTLLVVDDQSEHRQLIKSILEPLGFTVLEVASGEACLQHIKAYAPDLILLDLRMPGYDGEATAHQLRKQGFSMPIIVLSANAYPSDRLTAINAGCNDFLTKPIQISELLYKLKLHLALTWRYQEAATEEIATKLSPTNTHLKDMDGYVKIGDLFGLNHYLTELVKQQPGYQDFARQYIDLASEFKLQEIKKLLQQANVDQIS